MKAALPPKTVYVSYCGTCGKPYGADVTEFEAKEWTAGGCPPGHTIKVAIYRSGGWNPTKATPVIGKLRQRILTALAQADNASTIARSPAERVLADTVKKLTVIVAQLAEGNRQ